MKKLLFAFFSFLVLGLISAAAFAQGDAAEAAKPDTVLAASYLAAGLAIGLGVVGPGIGQGLTMLGALTGMARNPEMVGTLRLYMLLALAIIESLAIYALVIALILLYAI
jgi:F-type H+-transporting ATPase subunit c